MKLPLAPQQRGEQPRLPAGGCTNARRGSWWQGVARENRALDFNQKNNDFVKCEALALLQPPSGHGWKRARVNVLPKALAHVWMHDLTHHRRLHLFHHPENRYFAPQGKPYRRLCSTQTGCNSTPLAGLQREAAGESLQCQMYGRTEWEHAMK